MLNHAPLKTFHTLQVLDKLHYLVYRINGVLKNSGPVHVSEFGFGEKSSVLQTLVKIWRAEKGNRKRDKRRYCDFRCTRDEFQLASQVGYAASGHVNHQPIGKDHTGV